MSHELHSKAFAHSTCNQVGQSFVIHTVIQELAHETPRARSSKSTAGTFGVEVVEVLLGKTQVTNHVLVHPVVYSPLLPRSKVHLHFLVNETVSQRSWHAVSHTLVTFAVTCSHHDHVVRQHILANATVQDQLVCGTLHTWSGRVQLVQEQDHNRVLLGSFFVGQFDWWSPVHLANVFVVKRNTTDVSGFHLAQAQVDHETVEITGNAFNQFALANARRTPQEQRTFDTESCQQTVASLGGGYGTTI